MRDPVLQRVWDARDAISRRCDYDSRKLVRFYQSRVSSEDATESAARERQRQEAAHEKAKARG